MMKRILLFAKGACMGVADIIPGVSGGTLALILGIYAELVNSIKGLHLRWLAPLVKWALKRDDASRQAFLREYESLNVPFLVILGAGIATAIVAGSMVIPSLMERFPEAMRALFFGLIVASVVVPFKMIDFRGRKQRLVVAAMVVMGAVAGFLLTDPGRMLEASVRWTEVTSQQESLKDLTRREPSAWPTEQVFWAPENGPMREAIIAAHPELATQLGEAPTERIYDKDAIKARSERFDVLEVPAGVPVKIPQPALWFVFFAGVIGICAMILPGISGSYILLILGVYFFVLNALKGTITTLASGVLPWSSGIFVAAFMAGAAIGILSFARLLSFLLRRYPAITLGVLVGLMVGCLRGIWPFRATVDGMVVNIWPAAVDGAVLSALGTFFLGVILVTVLSRAGRKKVEGRVAHR
jgi:putative membrane protein